MVTFPAGPLWPTLDITGDVTMTALVRVSSREANNRPLITRRTHRGEVSGFTNGVVRLGPSRGMLTLRWSIAVDIAGPMSGGRVTSISVTRAVEWQCSFPAEGGSGPRRLTVEGRPRPYTQTDGETKFAVSGFRCVERSGTLLASFKTILGMPDPRAGNRCRDGLAIPVRARVTLPVRPVAVP